ncbi:ABC transporter permease [Nocardia uniformis]|uniref:ABC transporter permease n=1 Tax=Nocardia uniformis TaxID=53432 RepID=A0A849BZ62_9NOCA|nr:ABC transporter permease [Nocardia uniformis]NNH70568.1 ABC transporter permease [Nocardia uniformis]
MTTLVDSSTSWAYVRDQVRAEVIKVRSARSLWLLPLLAAALGPVTAIFVGLTGSMETGDTVLGGALTGATLALAVVAAWGALVITTEFSSGTIRPTLSATPQRGIILGAKVIVVGSVAAVVGLVSITAAYAVGVATIDSTKYAGGEPLPGLLGIYVCFPATALLGLATGVALRSSVGAVGAVTAHVVLPQLSSATAFGDLHRWVTVAAPSAVVAKLSQSTDGATELIGSLGGWPRLAIVIACTLSALAMAHRIIDRADL